MASSSPSSPIRSSAGVRRVNVSVDSRDRDTFKHITRRDRLPEVLAGIDAAERAGLKVKINTVALKRDNAHEIPDSSCGRTDAASTSR